MARKEFLLKSLVNYTACQDSSVPARGLDLKYGQVVAVVDSYDKNWWKACPIEIEEENGSITVHKVESDAGLIPSEKRYKRQILKKKYRHLKFRLDENKVDVIDSAEYVKEPQTEEEFQEILKNEDKEKKRSKGEPPVLLCDQASTIRKSMRDLASKIETNSIVAYKNLDQLNGSLTSSNSNLNQSLNNNQNNNTNGSSHSVNSNFSSNSKDQPCYEFVEPSTSSLSPRPIIILGHLRDRINDRLSENRADKFASVVPHTTRQMRSGETNGADYHFVSQDEMLKQLENGEFIEAGRYNEHLYGTSIQSIRNTSAEQLHALLDVSGDAIENLIKMKIHPIVILPIIPNFMWIQENSDGERIEEGKARQLFESQHQLHSKFIKQCTSQIQIGPIDNLDLVADEILRIIEDETSCVWLPIDSPVK